MKVAHLHRTTEACRNLRSQRHANGAAAEAPHGGISRKGTMLQSQMGEELPPSLCFGGTARDALSSSLAMHAASGIPSAVDATAGRSI